MYKKRILLILFISCSYLIFANNFTEKIEQFAEENGKGYLQPFVNAYGANLNSGLFHTAKVLKPFKFGISINSMLAFISKKDKIFVAVRPDLEDPMTGFPVYSPEEIESATVFGDQGAIFNFSGDPSHFSNEDDLKLPDGLNFNIAPLIIPQVNFGLPLGNEMMFRFFPEIEINSDLGALSFWGIGLKHSLNKNLLKLIPLDLAIQVVYHSFSIGEIIEMNSFSLNGEVSKKILNWTFYGGLGFNNTKLNAHYETETEIIIGNQPPYIFATVPTEIDFEINSKNIVPITLGVSYNIARIDFFVDYSICKYPVANFGFGLSF